MLADDRPGLRSVVFVSSTEMRLCGIWCRGSIPFWRCAFKTCRPHYRFFSSHRAGLPRGPNYSKKQFCSASGFAKFFSLDDVNITASCLRRNARGEHLIDAHPVEIDNFKFPLFPSAVVASLRQFAEQLHHHATQRVIVAPAFFRNLIQD